MDANQMNQLVYDLRQAPGCWLPVACTYDDDSMMDVDFCWTIFDKRVNKPGGGMFIAYVQGAGFMVVTVPSDVFFQLGKNFEDFETIDLKP